MSLESLPGFPGAGRIKLPASEAHAFTVHEFAQPALARVESALERRKPLANDWLIKQRTELGALLGAPDRPMAVADLEWAASARCMCGAGLSYPKFIRDPHGSWLCSAIILGTALPDSEHDEAKPFAFWSIKSDVQPSANGATTRPKETT